MKVLLKRFHLNSHTIGFYPQNWMTTLNGEGREYEKCVITVKVLGQHPSEGCSADFCVKVCVLSL